jgi:hypothetical protein
MISTSFYFIDPVSIEPGLGVAFHFLAPVAAEPGLSVSFHFDSPGFQKVGSAVRVKDLDVDIPFPTFVTTVASLPNPIGFFGHIAFVTDETGGPVLVYSDNLQWRRWTDGAIVS